MSLLELTHASGEPTYCCPTSRERERATSIAPPLPIEAGWRSPSCWARSGCSKDNSAKGRSGSRAASAMAGESRKLARRSNASGRIDPVREFFQGCSKIVSGSAPLAPALAIELDVIEPGVPVAHCRPGLMPQQSPPPSQGSPAASAVTGNQSSALNRQSNIWPRAIARFSSLLRLSALRWLSCIPV